MVIRIKSKRKRKLVTRLHNQQLVLLLFANIILHSVPIIVFQVRNQFHILMNTFLVMVLNHNSETFCRLICRMYVKYYLSSNYTFFHYNSTIINSNCDRELNYVAHIQHLLAEVIRKQKIIFSH
jgi:hypothetical protein